MASSDYVKKRSDVRCRTPLLVEQKARVTSHVLLHAGLAGEYHLLGVDSYAVYH